MANGVDFSFARLTAAQLKAAGFSFAARYLASATGKRLTATEISDFRANGIDIVLVWEDEATAALEGFNRGQHDAQIATEQANALGIPGNIPIYLAVDFDINDAQKPAAGEYFKGAASVSPRFRAGYGGYYLIKYLFENGLIDWAWQTVAWSGGQVDPRVHIYQNGQSAFGGQADIDEARQTNFGQWSTEEDMIDEGGVKILFQEFLGRAASQQDLSNVGQPWGNVVYELMISEEHKEHQQNIDNALAQAALVPALQKQVQDLQGQVNGLTAKTPITAPQKPLPQLSNNVPSPTVAKPEQPRVTVVATPSTSFWAKAWKVLFG